MKKLIALTLLTIVTSIAYAGLGEEQAVPKQDCSKTKASLERVEKDSSQLDNNKVQNDIKVKSK